MTKISEDQWEKANLVNSLEALEVLSEFIRSSKAWSAVEFTKVEGAAEKVKDFLKANKVPIKLWMLPSMRRTDVKMLNGIVSELLFDRNVKSSAALNFQKQRLKIAEIFIKEGASIWPSQVSRYLCSVRGKPLWSAPDFSWSATDTSENWVRFLFSHKGELLKGEALKLALKENDPLRTHDFITQFCTMYQSEVKSSGLKSSGVLGDADKRALAVVKWVLEQEASWLSQSLSQSSKEAKAIKAMLADAKVRVSAKTQVVKTEIDPIAIKKTLTKPQKERLKMLNHLVAYHAGDGEIIKSVLELTPWLKATPAIAALIVHPDKCSLIEYSLATGCEEALKMFDQWGVNLWLAAAQANQANPFEWVMSLGLNIEQVSVPSLSVARLLLKGAWLSGEQDPKAHCIKLAQAYLKGGHSYGQRRQRAETLLACLEKEVLEEVISSVLSHSASEAGAIESSGQIKTSRKSRL